MLSYPERPLANLNYRRELIDRGERDEKFRIGVIDRCKDDFLFFVGSFIWTFNPLKAGGTQACPFIPWECQKRAALKVPGEPWPGEMPADVDDAGLLWCIDKGQSLLIEKSRDMGISWLCLLVFDWRFLFKPYQKFLCISRNEAAVEDEDPDSLFWKLDWVHTHLPGWLCPDIRRRKRFFGNDRLGSTITGQASTGLAGVGGRATAMLIDEFSLIKEDREVRQRTASTTNCRIFNGTHAGMDTEFYALSQQPEVHKLNVHWTQHPEKIKGLYKSGPVIEVLDKGFDYGSDFNFIMDGSPVGGPRPGIRSPWYDAKCTDIGSTRGVAMDLDINPSGSVSQFFEPLVISDLIRHFCTDPYWEGDVTYDRETGRKPELQRKATGPLRLWVQPDVEGKFSQGRYGAGADISMGTGASNSCLSLGNADTGEKILEYANSRIAPDDFAALCIAVLMLFKDSNGDPPLLCWENRGPGVRFTVRLKELGYHRFYYETNEKKLVGKRIEATEPGWNPLNTAKLSLLEVYRQSLVKRLFLNRSESALTELLVWKYSKDGYPVWGRASPSEDGSGARDNHGDQTIADALCLKMLLKLGISERKKEIETAPFGSLAWRTKLHAMKPVNDGWVEAR